MNAKRYKDSERQLMLRKGLQLQEDGMTEMFRKNRYGVIAAATAAALLTGFLLGRLTAPGKESSGQTQAAADSSESADVVNETDSAAETDTEEAGTEEDAASQRERDLNGDLVDAAEQTYENMGSGQNGELITHEAQATVGTEETTLDPSEIEDTTLIEAPLPDGVASTLYGKTADTALFQVVVMGDSQFGNFLGEDGLAYLLSQKLHANVYNLSIGGKCAAAEEEDRGKDVSQWGTTCGVNLTKAVCGLVSNSVLDGYDYQKNVFNSCDFSKTDLFVIEYGVNDYLSKKPMYDEEDPGCVQTVFGALETMILDIRSTYPEAKILICTPTYAQFWQGGTGAFLGDSNIVNNGYGTLFNYVETISHPAGGHTQTGTVNAYENTGINIYSASEDLLDGIHMTAQGRIKYANLLSRVALRCMGYDIGEGVDPDTVDWTSQTPGK